MVAHTPLSRTNAVLGESGKTCECNIALDSLRDVQILLLRGEIMTRRPLWMIIERISHAAVVDVEPTKPIRKFHFSQSALLFEIV